MTDAPSFEARNPDFETRVRASFARQKVMQTLGARLRSVAPGRVEIELPFREDLTQQHGFLHAGIVATLADSACGYAAFSLMAAGAAVVASDLTAFMDVSTLADGGHAAAHHAVGDPASIAASVIALLDDPAERAALAERGRECAAAFDWSNVAPRVEETYRDAIRMDAEFHPHPTKDVTSP